MKPIHFYLPLIFAGLVFATNPLVGGVGQQFLEFEESVYYSRSGPIHGYIITGITDSAVKNIAVDEFIDVEGYWGEVIGVSAQAFRGHPSLESMELPESIRVIQNDAFRDCSKLRTINLPSLVEEIGPRAFRGCEKLEQISIPNRVSVINIDTFYGCESLAMVTLAEGLRQIASRAFTGCNSLETLNIPASTTSIAFPFIADSIREYSISPSNTAYRSISGIVYDVDITSLISCPKNYQQASVVIPETVVEIKRSAFMQCNFIQEIILPDGLQNIEFSAFSFVTALTAITIPEHTQIQTQSFLQGAVNLEFIDVHPNNPYFRSQDGVLLNSDGSILVRYPPAKADAEYRIPAGVEEIHEKAFIDNATLETIIFPEGLTHIHDYAFFGDAFEGNSISTLFLPASVTHIGVRAFQYCDNVNYIVFAGDAPAIGVDAFFGVRSRMLFLNGAEGFDGGFWDSYAWPIMEASRFLNYSEWQTLFSDNDPENILLEKSDRNLVTAYASNSDPRNSNAVSPISFSEQVFRLWDGAKEVTYTVFKSENLIQWDAVPISSLQTDESGLRILNENGENDTFYYVKMVLKN